MENLEISVLNKIYNATLYLFEPRNNVNLYLLSKYEDINDDSHQFLKINEKKQLKFGEIKKKKKK